MGIPMGPPSCESGRMREGYQFHHFGADRRRLNSIAAAPRSPQKHVWRARIILLSGDGLGTSAIMAETGKSKTCVWRWQERFMREGVNGLLRDKSRPPGKAPVAPERVAEIVRLTQQPPPHEATHWTIRAMAKVAGVAASTVQAIWKAHGLSPHRFRQFKLSKDPAFAAKLTAIVGLYVDPPAHAVVLSIDEKSQIQALDRTQPGLPMKQGRAGTMTHDYKRHGTTTLFAALNVLDGTVIGQNMQRHRHQEFIRFLNRIEREVPPDKAIPRGPRQLCGTQKGQGPEMARTPSALDLPLHANLLFMAQCRRRLLRQAGTAPAEERCLPFPRRSPGRHQSLHSRIQRQQPQAVYLES